MKMKREVQIGLLTIVALAICYVGINFLKGIEIFKKSTTYYAHFDNLSSVTVATRYCQWLQGRDGTRCEVRLPPWVWSNGRASP